MTKAPIRLQDLRRRIYRKAKSEKTHRFWGLFVHVTKIETLEEAYRIAKRNGGAAGTDEQSFSDIEAQGLADFLRGIREDLITGRYKPSRTAGWRSRREMAKFECFRFLASATAWCKAH
jgi:RNA-directed DNA polymerase